MDISTYVRPARGGTKPGSARAGPDSESKSTVDLSRQAVRLLLALDVARHCRALPSTHPHILNRLAGIWRAPAEAERYLEELLLTARAGRQGFPSVVVTELTLLREKNRKRLAPVPQDVWLQAMLR